MIFQIGAHCKIVDTVIMDDVRIEDNVSLTGCIVCSDVIIRNNSSLKGIYWTPRFLLKLFLRAVIQYLFYM